MSNRDRFLAIVEAAVGGSASAAAVLDLRNHELQTYISTAAHLDSLLKYCKQCLATGVNRPNTLGGSSSTWKAHQFEQKSTFLPYCLFSFS